VIAIHAAGHTVCAKGGRVWLHRQHDGDGDLAPDQALALADALQEAAAAARRQRPALEVDDAARRARRALGLAVEYTMGDEEGGRG
jgi:hypothetical protein